MKSILLIMSILTTGAAAAQMPTARKTLLQQDLTGLTVETVKMDQATLTPDQPTIIINK
ncbi:hypothetical protein AB6805_04200 [Chitinophaga sp. RCC_12]|uniref:hypothetical protein n=1 Tax=Chitinophaga sp. RCC_12 TaxID=3239226 RepID=UPI003526BAB9